MGGHGVSPKSDAVALAGLTWCAAGLLVGHGAREAAEGLAHSGLGRRVVHAQVARPGGHMCGCRAIL